MADPARGALVARLGEKAASLETQLLFFPLEWAAVDDDAAEALLADAALDDWRHHLRGLRKFRPYLLSEPEEKIVTEKTVSGRRRLVAALRGATRRAPGLARRRGAVARGRDVAALRAQARAATRGRRRDHRGARPRPADANLRLQHDPAGQVDRRPAAQLSDLDLLAEPLERDDRRGGRGARRGRDLALRRAAALLPPQGEAPRARPARALRPLRARLGGHGEDTVGRGAADRRRGVLRLLRGGRLDRRAASSTTPGSTRPSGPTSAPAPSARRPCPASTRTSS